MKRTKLISFLLTGVFLFALSTESIQAKWKDKSGDLPGMNDDSGTTTALIAGGVVITGLVVYLIVRKKKQKKSVSSLKDKQSMLFTQDAKESGFYNEVMKASEQSSIQLFTRNGFNDHSFTCNTQAVGIGLRFKF